MYSSTANIRTLMADFHIAGMMLRYSAFIPRLYNLSKSLGFEPGKIMPSRAFCSDENQGYPIILITQHFGVFPFNHGQVGGIVATDRHAPHAEHGRDMSTRRWKFDRTFRTIVREHSYRGKRVLYVSGLNIDISPQTGQRFPLTKFVPWAAFVQQPDGSHETLEQAELLARLRAQPSENPDRIDLEASIQQMEQAREIRVSAP